MVWCLRVLSKLGSELDIRKLLNPAYEWFVDQDGGLAQMCLYVLNQHSDIIENVVSVMFQFGKYNMLELFNLHLKSLTVDLAQYMDLVTDIYSTVSEEFFVITPEVLDFWIETAIQQADGDSQTSVSEKTSALSFLAEVWISKSERIEQREDTAHLILKLLNKCSREHSKVLKF